MATTATSPYTSLPIGSILFMTALRASRAPRGADQVVSGDGLPEIGWRCSEAGRRLEAERLEDRDVGRRRGRGERGRNLDERVSRVVSRQRDDDRRVFLWDRRAAVRPAEARVLLRRRALMIEPIVRARHRRHTCDRGEEQGGEHAYDDVPT